MDNKIINLLKNISNEDLISFVVGYAENDEKLSSEIISKFGVPDLNEELKKVKSQSSIAVREGTRSGYIDYGGCIHVCNKFDEIVLRVKEGWSKGI